MKYNLIIDEEREEEIIIYAHKKSPLIFEIEKLLEKKDEDILGYKNGEIAKLNPKDIYCFFIENNKTFALLENEKMKIKNRLYKIEENLSSDFIKINQSCLANIKKIEKFDVSISGTMKVIFKNGYVDFVSRRNLKNVKERLGIRWKNILKNFY